MKRTLCFYFHRTDPDPQADNVCQEHYLIGTYIANVAVRAFRIMEQDMKVRTIE